MNVDDRIGLESACCKRQPVGWRKPEKRDGDAACRHHHMEVSGLHRRPQPRINSYRHRFPFIGRCRGCEEPDRRVVTESPFCGEKLALGGRRTESNERATTET